MIVADMITWWYLKGWKIFIAKLGNKFRDTVDFFSIGSLMKTLFTPFRQISAGGTSSAALGERFRAFLDQLVSRIIGAIVRIGILIAGTIVLILQFILSVFSVILWPLLPFLPVICILLTMMKVGT